MPTFPFPLASHVQCKGVFPVPNPMLHSMLLGDSVPLPADIFDRSCGNNLGTTFTAAVEGRTTFSYGARDGPVPFQWCRAGPIPPVHPWQRETVQRIPGARCCFRLFLLGINLLANIIYTWTMTSHSIE